MSPKTIVKFWSFLMNLDEYINKNELGEFDIEKIEKFSQNQSIGTILRLYTSYGEASKIGIYNDDSLNWIVSRLEKALSLAGFERAASLVKTNINESFSLFWAQFKEFNNSNSPELSQNLDLNRA